MKQALLSLLAVLALTTSSAGAEIIDDFSAGGWREFSSTPGEMSIEQGKMRLVDAPGQPGWMTASKTFTVDFEKTPTFSEYMKLRIFLEDLLSATVDLVTEAGLKQRARPHVERDAIRVA